VLFLVPVVNVALFGVACLGVARAFRKSRCFAVGLMLLPPVYMAVLGMGRARYRRFEVIAGDTEEPGGPSPRPGARARAARWPAPVRPAPASSSARS
jgi:hypothetical protein